jgi:hypothetical protein
MVLLLGAVIAGWVGLRGIPTVFKDWQEARWEVQDRARLLAQSRREIANEKVLVDSAARVKEGMIALAPQLVTGETAAQASDALTGLLGVVAARSNTKLTGTTAVEDSTEVGTLRRVAIHAVLDGDIRGVTAMLQSLAEEETVLTADDLRIVAPEMGGDPSMVEVLRFEFTVRGWYQVDRQSAGQ